MTPRDTYGAGQPPSSIQQLASLMRSSAGLREMFPMGTPAESAVYQALHGYGDLNVIPRETAYGMPAVWCVLRVSEEEALLGSSYCGRGVSAHAAALDCLASVLSDLDRRSEKMLRDLDDFRGGHQPQA